MIEEIENLSTFSDFGLFHFVPAVLLPVGLFCVIRWGSRISEGLFTTLLFFSGNVSCFLALVSGFRAPRDMKFGDYILLTLPAVALLFVSFMRIARFRPNDTETIRMILAKSKCGRWVQSLKAVLATGVFLFAFWGAFKY